MAARAPMKISAPLPREFVRHSLELRHLRYFIVLAEELHFGHAARRLHMTQPPLSAAIRTLESQLGAALFVRNSRSVRLTSVGAAFLPEAVRTVMQAHAAEEAGRALAAGKVGQLQIGFTSSMLYRGVPRLLKLFHSQQPGVEIRLSDLTVAEQAQALLQQRLHGGFSPGQTVPHGLRGKPLADDAFVCCVHEEHPAAHRRSLKLAELRDDDFIIFQRAITPSGYDHFVSMCLRAGFMPREKAQVRQWITAALLVSQGFGVAVVPASLKKAHIQNVKFIRLEDEHTHTSGYFIWNPASVSVPLEHLIGLIP
ncbi:MAG: hypothetical protein RI949_2506 [Pseudomonadota bacterium]